MGEDDGRRPYGEPADADKPWQAQSDDEESELGDFVFPDESDEDFVFPDGSAEGETNDEPRNTTDTADTADTPDTTGSETDRYSEGRATRRTNERRDTTPSNPNERRHTDSETQRRRSTDPTGLDESRTHRDRYTDSSGSTADLNSPNQNQNQNSDVDSDPDPEPSSESSSGHYSRNSWGEGSDDPPWKRDPSPDPEPEPTDTDDRDSVPPDPGPEPDTESDPISDPTTKSSGVGSTRSEFDETTTATDDYAASTGTGTGTGSSESPSTGAGTGTGASTRTKSDGGTLTSESAETDVSMPAIDEDDALVPSGPTEDQEMPLSDHIEEMVRRVLVVVVVMSLVSAIAFPFADRLINFIWYSIFHTASSNVVRPRVYHPLALVLARLKVATLAGFVVALPVFVYETYLFMRPGLYPRERRYYIAAIPTSLVLAALGVVFAFKVVLPLMFIYFLGYSQGVAHIAFGLADTFGLMLLLIGFFALIFQIPLFIMLAVMMGVTSRKWLTDRRLYFWGGFAGIAFITNPDPTGMVPFIVTLSMVILFEATLLLLKWTNRG